MYLIADLLDLAKIEPPRPILPLGAEARAQVKAALKALNDLPQ
jgi:4-hydroxy-tetrahydrodipicolinate synthase